MASYIIQPNSSRALPITRTVVLVRCAGESKLATHCMGIIYIPEIIAHCAPSPAVVNFNTAIIITTICQPKVRWAVSTNRTGISAVGAIMRAPSTMSALVQMWFAAWAGHVIHPNRASPLAIMGASVGIGSQPRETKLSANHVSVTAIPSIITNCSPLVIIEDFNSSIVQTVSPQTNGPLIENLEIGK